MNNKRLIIVGLLILAVAIVGKLLFIGLKNVKVDDFKPAAIMFVIDASASNQNKLPEQKKFLKQLCAVLDPEDQIKIIRVSQDSYLIYEGTPQDASGMTKAMNSFTQYDANENGTAYGEGLKKAFAYALTMQKDGYSPAIVVMGDLENEGATDKQIDWDLLPENVKNIQKYSPDLSMTFLFAHPKKLDLVKEKLGPVLGETKLVISSEETVDKSVRKFIKAIGR